MRNCIFVLVLSVIPFITSAQTAPISSTNEVYADELVSITTSTIDCVNLANGTAKEYVVFSIWNKDENSIKISFKKEVWFDGKCSNCESIKPQHLVDLEIMGNSKVQGSCETENTSLRIFSKMLELKNVRKLTHYELKNINVQKL